ncbi:MAG: GNAT family N-acetyltransferase [Burkholderiales bacterium]|nr:GNAT family N-acetyltransferase [Burkholderiales bacterium]
MTTPDSPPFSLRPARLDDAATLSALAIQVFLDTYAAEGVRPDLAREALREYAVDAFDARLREPARRFVLAERGTGLLGFAELTLTDQAAPAGGVTGSELIRLYVQPAAQGSGLGRQLIRAAETVAAEAGLPALWLTAWDGNHRALAFYARQGYADVGATSYSFEGNRYGNRVLARGLDPNR